MKKDNYFIFGVWFGIKRVAVKKVRKGGQWALSSAKTGKPKVKRKRV